MKSNKSGHNRFILWLDRTAEKNPLLWLPCVLMIALGLAGERIAEYARIAYMHRNTEKIVKERPQLERKPFALRAVAVTLTAAFSLMLVPAASLNAFGEKYEPIIVSDEASDENGTPVQSEPIFTEVPIVTEEPTVSEEPVVTEPPAVTDESTATEEPTVTEPPFSNEDPSVSEEFPPETLFPEEPLPITDNFNADFLFDAGISLLSEDHSGHRVHDWDQDDDYHWRFCETCGREIDRERHNYNLVQYIAPTATKFGEKRYLCKCGMKRTESIPKTSDSHTYLTEWDYDANSHWHNCIQYPTCQVIQGFGQHIWGSWNDYSENYHVRECTTCGYREIDYHTYGAWQKDSTGHWRTCTVCNHVDRRDHDIPINSNPWDYKYDNGSHWLECSVCGYQASKETHDINPDDWQHNNTHHRKGCTICMYATEQELHDLRWETYDDNQKHRQICDECGAVINDGEHIWQWATDDTSHWQKCRICPEIRDVAEHVFSTDWSSDNRTHWHECTSEYVIDGQTHVCGYRKDEAAHTPDEETWYGDDDNHWRKCSTCDKDISITRHNYTHEYDDAMHWDICDDCGHKAHAEFHSYKDPIYTYDDDGVTPIKRYECVGCDYFYTESLWHDHDFGNVWKYNDIGHWRECKFCHGKIDGAFHVLSSEVTLEPTETAEGTRVYTCNVCGYSYDETIPKLEHVHVFDTEWHNDANEHWHECPCGEKSDIASHIFVNGVCTVCGYATTTETPSPAPVYSAEAPLRLPYITNSPDIRGWLNIAAYINASPDERTIPVTMNGDNNMPKEIAECIHNRDIVLEMNAGGAVWTINGFDVSNPKTVNLRVSEVSDKIPESVLRGLGSELEPKEYRLYHSGDLGFMADMTLNVGKKYNDHYAALYCYDAKTGQTEFIDECFVDSRYVTFRLTHASYYAVAFSSAPVFTDVSSGAGAFESSVPLETSAMPETNGVTIPAVKLPQIMKYSGRKRRYRILKKRQLDDMVFVL